MAAKKAQSASASSRKKSGEKVAQKRQNGDGGLSKKNGDDRLAKKKVTPNVIDDRHLVHAQKRQPANGEKHGTNGEKRGASTKSESSSLGNTKRQRVIVAIGGREEKQGKKAILTEVARRVGSGKLVVTTVASYEPEGVFEEYDRIFRSLGVQHIYNMEINSRADAMSPQTLRVLDDAAAVFFTGGDQLRITSQIGDTPVFFRLREIYECGGMIAGTSAGASVICETMLVGGGNDASHRIGDNLNMAPGLALITGVIVDQHFAERGRMGRLLGAIAQNPMNLGIGIDENTAIVIEHEEYFYVLGSGAVYVIDGEGVTASNISEASSARTMSIYDVKLHVLSQGDKFDLRTRRPAILSDREATRLLEPVNGK